MYEAIDWYYQVIVSSRVKVLDTVLRSIGTPKLQQIELPHILRRFFEVPHILPFFVFFLSFHTFLWNPNLFILPIFYMFFLRVTRHTVTLEHWEKCLTSYFKYLWHIRVNGIPVKNSSSTKFRVGVRTYYYIIMTTVLTNYYGLQINWFYPLSKKCAERDSSRELANMFDKSPKYFT